jgi:hypothetical protein
MFAAAALDADIKAQSLMMHMVCTGGGVRAFAFLCSTGIVLLHW